MRPTCSPLLRQLSATAATIASLLYSGPQGRAPQALWGTDPPHPGGRQSMALALPSLHCIMSFPDQKIIPILQNRQPRQG